MKSDATETPTWQQTELLADLDVCLECFNLRGSFEGTEHRCDCVPRDDRWRERVWPHADIPALVDLCNLCARATMKSGSRYTWLVCDDCLAVNRTVGSVLGSSGRGALPVGRHSIMNGVRFGGGDLGDAEISAFAEWFFGLTKVWRRLMDWGPEEAKRLSTVLGNVGETVPLPVWLGRFPTSRGASADAFCRFVEYDLPEHPSLRPLNEARAGFTAARREGR